MKPVLFYIDDEIRNIAAFEALISDDYELHTYSSAVDALKKVKELNPWLIITDQRMPQMQGLEFLEICSQLVPKALRIVVTGQTDESTIVQLIRRAKIFDYITKPWDVEVLQNQIEKAVEFYRLSLEKESALQKLEAKNLELVKSIEELKNSRDSEAQLERELAAWLPQSLVSALKQKSLSMTPNRYQERSIVAITYDIVNSSQYHGMYISGRSLRSHVYYLFLLSLLKKDGVVEASGGDSVYAHFGAFASVPEAGLRAFAVAEEFRQALSSFCHMHKIEIACGISIHTVPRALLTINEIVADTPQGPVLKKSYETTSPDIDLLFRVERLGHSLKGTNIFVTDELLATLPDAVKTRFKALGKLAFRGERSSAKIFTLPDPILKDQELEDLVKAHRASDEEKDVA